MIQFQDNPWQQSCPLPLSSEPAEQGKLPSEEGCVALPLVAAERTGALPPALLDDDYQWMVLL